MKILLFLEICLVEIIVSHETRSAQRCRFPQEWRGRYFQSGLGEIVVKDAHITTKGSCLEQKRDYYLLDNRESGCYYCLLILSQHRNILQYKESHCTSQSDLETVCAQIKVETPLFTLIREQATPIPCPFTDFYHFDYNDLDRGFCQERTSVASPCSASSRYRLKFRHCKKQAVYNGKDIEMECLATWKDGSEAYLYARLIAEDIEGQDEKYRCLKYHNYGNDVTLSMSVDATCIGLRSPTDGPFLMSFNRVESSNEQSPPCRFPDWFRDVTWRDLTGQLKLHADESLATLIQKGRRHGGSGQSKEHVQTIHRCRWFLTKSSNEESETYIYKSYSSQDCDSQHQCFRLHRTKHNILTVSEGFFDNIGDPFEACSSNSTYSRHQFFMPLNSTGTSCPRPGVHHTRPTDLCVYRLNVGCAAPSFISIDHSCSADQPGIVLECLAAWNDVTSSRNYVMVRHRSDNTILCYSFRRENNSDLFGVDALCPYNHGTITTMLLKSQITTSYSIDRHETCKTRIPNPRLAGPHVPATKGTHIRPHPTESSYPSHQKQQSHRRKIANPNGHPTKPPTFHQKPLSSSAIPLGTITSIFSFGKEGGEERPEINDHKPFEGGDRRGSKPRDPFVIVGSDDEYGDEDDDDDDNDYGSGPWFETTLVGKKRGTDTTNQDRVNLFYNNNNSVKYGTHQEETYDQELYAQWHGMGSRKGVLRSHENKYPINRHHRTTPHGLIKNLPQNNSPNPASVHHNNNNNNNVKHSRVAVLDGNQFKQSSSSSSSSTAPPLASIISAIAAAPNLRILPPSLASYLSLTFLCSYFGRSPLEYGASQDSSSLSSSPLSSSSSLPSSSSTYSLDDDRFSSRRIENRESRAATRVHFYPDAPVHSEVKRSRGKYELRLSDVISFLNPCNMSSFHRMLRQLASINSVLALMTLLHIFLCYL